MGGRPVVVITHKHLQAARMAGACDAIKKYREGTPVTQVLGQHLQWFADRFPEWAYEAAETIAAESGLQIVGTPPLDLLSHSDGYFDDGFGYSDGYGHDDGCGQGDGYGHDDGDGHGDGCGHIYGYGYGDGDGYGDGANYGSGYRYSE